MENGVTTRPTVALFLALAIAAHAVAGRPAIAGTDADETLAAIAGETHTVPGDFATIQACIDAAQDGDECVVAPGTYHELIDFLGKAITLRSSDGRDVTIIDAGPVEDNVSGKSVVSCVSGEGSGTVLDGFTITGGTGTVCPLAVTFRCGGGMFNQNSSPTVTNCTFSGNTVDAHGGGIYNENSSPSVTKCTFLRNTAGIGGAIYNTESSNPRVTDCIFSGNTARWGGAMFNLQGSSPFVSNCAFTGNTAESSGGAMYNRIDSNPTVIDSVFRGNTARERAGGGMFNIGSSPIVTNCTFSGNTAGVFGGGGIYNSFSSSPALTNSIFWGNSPNEILNINLATIPQFSFCDIQHSGGSRDWDASLGFDNGGNIDADPQFVRKPNPRLNDWDGVDDDFGKLKLKARSPAINAGDPAFVVAEEAIDLAGKPRLRGCRIDMGAFESPSGQGRGDFNFDGDSDLADFAAFQLCFGPDDPDPNWRRDCHCVFRDGDDDGDDDEGSDDDGSDDQDQPDAIDLEDFAGFVSGMRGPR